MHILVIGFNALIILQIIFLSSTPRSHEKNPCFQVLSQPVLSVSDRPRQRLDATTDSGASISRKLIPQTKQQRFKTKDGRHSNDVKSKKKGSYTDQKNGSHDKLSNDDMLKKILKEASFKLALNDPPSKSYILGSSVPAQVDIALNNPRALQAYLFVDSIGTTKELASVEVINSIMEHQSLTNSEAPTASRTRRLLICTSMDFDPWFCWSLSDDRETQIKDKGKESRPIRVFYTDVIQGSHILKAQLCVMTGSFGKGDSMPHYSSVNNNETKGEDTLTTYEKFNMDEAFYITPMHAPQINDFVNIDLDRSSLQRYKTELERSSRHQRNNYQDQVKRQMAELLSREKKIPHGMVNHMYMNHLMKSSPPEGVSVQVPVVQFMYPPWNSTLVDTSSTRVTVNVMNFSTLYEQRNNATITEEEDMKLSRAFQLWFRYSMVCVNANAGSGSACFPLFTDDGDSADENHSVDKNKGIVSFILSGLRAGVHTLEARITRPDTGELIDESYSNVHVFYTS